MRNEEMVHTEMGMRACDWFTLLYCFIMMQVNLIKGPRATSAHDHEKSLIKVTGDYSITIR